MDGPPRAGAMRSVAYAAVASALLLVGCASSAENRSSGGSPAFNAGGPMEVHPSPTEAAGEQIRVPDVKGEDWEDAARTPSSMRGSSSGMWSRSRTAIPGGR